MMSESEKEQFQRMEEAYRKLWAEHEELKLRIKAEYAEFKLLCDEVGFIKSAKEEPTPVVKDSFTQPIAPATSVPKSTSEQIVRPVEKSSLERFIGEQLLSKIGIAILLIGVGIGVKYAIDHNLIGSAGRIFAGYLLATVLGLFAFRYRIQFPSFSAVLASGAVSITYFITFAAYSYYLLFPLELTFVGLLVTVGIAVYLSLYYNLAVIAHLGLVGAYILPPLVSDETTHIAYYFAYMLVINGGMLVLSMKKNWSTIHYPIIVWTTFVFCYWFNTDYQGMKESVLAATFLFLFFSVLVLGTIGRLLVKKEALSRVQLVQLIAVFTAYFSGLGYVFNSSSWGFPTAFILLATGFCFAMWYYAKLRNHEELSLLFQVLTLYTIISLLTIWTGSYAYLFSLINSALFLSFTAKSVHKEPIQSVIVVMCSLASFCLLIASFFDHGNSERLLGNDFTRTLLSINLLFGLYFIVQRVMNVSTEVKVRSLIGYFSFFIALFSVLVVCNYYYELIWENAYLSKYLHTAFGEGYYLDRRLFDTTSLASTSTFVLFSLVLMQLFRKRILKEVQLPAPMQVIGTLVFYSSLLFFSMTLSDVLEMMNRTDFWSAYCLIHATMIGSVLTLIFLQRTETEAPDWYKALGMIAILWLLSVELVHWSLYAGFGPGYKIFLTLLWVSFAISIMVIGIKRKQVLLRVTAMVILGISMLKLFMYDLTALSTIYKTIVFIAIGGLFLVGAYYYQLVSKQDTNNR